MLEHLKSIYEITGNAQAHCRQKMEDNSKISIKNFYNAGHSIAKIQFFTIYSFSPFIMCVCTYLLTLCAELGGNTSYKHSILISVNKLIVRLKLNILQQQFQANQQCLEMEEHIK